MLLRIIFLCSVLLVPAQIFAQAKALDAGKVSFTVAEAPWSFILDAEGFTIDQQKIKPDGKNAYFLLNNEKTGVTFSLFIEPAVNCKTSEACRDMVYQKGNPAWENSQNVVQSKIGDISYFEFLIPSFQGQPIRQQNMYAEFVTDGYWIDLHISKTLYKKEDRALFERIVKSAKFEAKTKPAAENNEKALSDAQKALEVWTPLWDAGKYEDAYAEMASYTRETIKANTWRLYWMGARQPLGKLKTRALFKSEYIKSMKGLPDREGAIFQYQSSFENRESVLETFALMREADGAWRVANYLTN
ncbi:MAG TPA: DUF4019 domain-containing protein [Pyrinomonadaceae bacterium]|jgi:hypothetical protein